MSDQFEIRSDAMPDEMRILLAKYPREEWPAHPGFKEKTQQWLAAHQMFRRLSEAVRLDTEQYLDGNKDADDYSARLSYRGNALVGNLHGHHAWEDLSYFPELSAADRRFDDGLEILENDHHALDVVLESFTNSAIRTIKLIHFGENSARDEAGKLHIASQSIEAFLKRHLSDEEELAVPIILHHRLRG